MFTLSLCGLLKVLQFPYTVKNMVVKASVAVEYKKTTLSKNYIYNKLIPNTFIYLLHYDMLLWTLPKQEATVAN